MGNYNETQISGDAYTRAYHIAISNELNTPPVIHYHEEQVLNVGGEQIRRQTGQLSVVCDDMDKTITIRNPLTGELTGQTITIGEVYALIYSHYWQSATERDNAE